MKRPIFLFVLSLLFAIISFTACQKLESSANQKTSLNLPAQTPQYFGDNHKAELGRVLFYDRALSLNNRISCGSCHKQSAAFADVERFSRGFENGRTQRNTPPIQNISLSGQALFWDGRSRDLKNMSTMPIFDHLEMGVFDPDQLVMKVKARPYYGELFMAAFGSAEITLEQISEALATFIASIRSNGSAFDRGQISFNNGSPSHGKELFFGKYNCGSCHNLFSPIGYNGGLTNDSSASELLNIGLDRHYQDGGLAELTGSPGDRGKFKIPNLRNVALTGPYMHDGRFETLEEVIEHYNNGVQDHPNLDSRLRAADGSVLRLEIPPEDKKALIRFMESLTDHQLISDSRFSDPFVRQ